MITSHTHLQSPSETLTQLIKSCIYFDNDFIHSNFALDLRNVLILSCGCRYPTQRKARRSSKTNRARGNNNQVTSGSLQQYPVAAVAASYWRTSDRVAATVRRTASPTPSAHASARQPATTGDQLWDEVE